MWWKVHRPPLLTSPCLCPPFAFCLECLPHLVLHTIPHSSGKLKLTLLWACSLNSAHRARLPPLLSKGFPRALQIPLEHHLLLWSLQNHNSKRSLLYGHLPGPGVAGLWTVTLQLWSWLKTEHERGHWLLRWPGWDLWLRERELWGKVPFCWGICWRGSRTGTKSVTEARQLTEERLGSKKLPGGIKTDSEVGVLLDPRTAVLWMTVPQMIPSASLPPTWKFR